MQPSSGEVLTLKRWNQSRHGDTAPTPQHRQQLFMGTPEGHHQLPKWGSTLHLQVWAPPSPPRHLFWIESPTGKLLSYTVRVMPCKRSTLAGVSYLDFYNLIEVCLLLSKISITCSGSSPPHLVSATQNLPEKKKSKIEPSFDLKNRTQQKGAAPPL